MTEKLPSLVPSLVIVGRPNVGKSTLFNRLTGTRRSIVTNEPGITRDRIYGRAHWRGREIEVVDTGGLLPDDKALIPQEIFRQARVAIAKAALLVLVVDSHAGLTPLDAELARMMRATGKPFVVAANKVDVPRQEAEAAGFHALGVPVFPIAAEHGAGVDDLLDYALKLIEGTTGEAGPPALVEQRGVSGEEEAQVERVIEVAIIGRPNVGKSTLLNRLVGEERAIVAPEAGTTRDSVDTEARVNGRLYRFVDTAGIRKKGKTKLVAEKLSVVMARRALERADVALLVVDAAHGVTQGDATIATYAEQSGRSVILVMNKWDLAVEAARAAAEEVAAGDSSRRTTHGELRRTGKAAARWSAGPPARRQLRRAGEGETRKPGPGFQAGRLLLDYEELVRKKLKFLSYAPIVFLSASTGDRTEKLYPLIEQVAAARRRIPTPELNRWLAQVDLSRGTSPKARLVKIFYMMQASASPPTFLLFTNQKRPLHFSFERFLENQLRAKFDFTGTPVRFVQRLRKREQREKKQRKAWKVR